MFPRNLGGSGPVDLNANAHCTPPRYFGRADDVLRRARLIILGIASYCVYR